VLSGSALFAHSRMNTLTLRLVDGRLGSHLIHLAVGAPTEAGIRAVAVHPRLGLGLRLRARSRLRGRVNDPVLDDPHLRLAANPPRRTRPLTALADCRCAWSVRRVVADAVTTAHTLGVDDCIAAGGVTARSDDANRRHRAEPGEDGEGQDRHDGDQRPQPACRPVVVVVLDDLSRRRNYHRGRCCSLELWRVDDSVLTVREDLVNPLENRRLGLETSRVDALLLREYTQLRDRLAVCGRECGRAVLSGHLDHPFHTRRPRPLYGYMYPH
jgi:hypothetical protein